MRLKNSGRMVAAVCLACAALQSHADDAIRRLLAQAERAHARGELDVEADSMCQAAKENPHQYGKTCDQARQNAAKAVAGFDEFFKAARHEMEANNYANASAYLNRITFGPHLAEAHKLLGLLPVPGGHSTVEGESRLAIEVAHESYARGDFNRAVAEANKVQGQGLQAEAKQIVTNVQVYRNTMTEAAVLAARGDYKAAQEKYQFAKVMLANGPGNPESKLQQMNSLLATRSPDAVPTLAPGVSQPPVKKDVTEQVKNAMRQASLNELHGNWKKALLGYNAVLALDSHHVKALAGKQRATDALTSAPETMQLSLEQGIRSYYASDFTQSKKQITLYLSAGGSQEKGPAHFYLGASLLSEALLADPQDSASGETARKGALKEFQLARQRNFHPAQKLVSPRILEEWQKLERKPQ